MFESYSQAQIDHQKLQAEKRHGWVVLGAKQLEGDFFTWKGLNTLVMVENFRAEKGKVANIEYRYYISSKNRNAEQAGQAIRAIGVSSQCTGSWM